MEAGLGLGEGPRVDLAPRSEEDEEVDEFLIGVGHGRAVDERLAASVGAALAAVAQGARVVRVHDVAATVDALKVWHAAGLLDGADTASRNSVP